MEENYTNILQHIKIKMGYGEDTQVVEALWFPCWRQASLSTTPSALIVAELWDVQN
jgi:hypothetical protein